MQSQQYPHSSEGMGLRVGSMAGEKGPYYFPGLHCDLRTRGFGRDQIKAAKSGEVLKPILRQTNNSRSLQNAIVSKGAASKESQIQLGGERKMVVTQRGESTIFLVSY